MTFFSRNTELPDGSSIVPPRHIPGGITGSDQTVIREAEYIGSFAVKGLGPKERVEFISKQLEGLRNPSKSTPIILAIALSGIKVYNQTGQKIYMGHAMRRISYATCDPEFCQFSFLCREPNGPVDLQYCHAFLTKTPETAEELNNIVGDAFKMSYARLKLTHANQTNFNDTLNCQSNRHKNSHQDKKSKRTKSSIIEDVATEAALERKENEFSPRTTSSLTTSHIKSQSELLKLHEQRIQATCGSDKLDKRPVSSYSTNSQSSIGVSDPPSTVASAATQAFRQASALGGCPVVAMKESIDQTSSSSSYVGPNGDSTGSGSGSGGRGDKNYTDTDLLVNSHQRTPDTLTSVSTINSSTASSVSTLPDGSQDSAYHHQQFGSGSGSGSGGRNSAAPPLPARFGSLRGKYDAVPQSSSYSDSVASRAAWFQANIPREIALEVLAQEEVGAFVVRDSSTHPGCYALSAKVPKFDNPAGIAHYLIQRTQRGVKLKGLDKEWPNLHALVVHLTVMPEMLPCTLKLPRQTCNPGFQDDGTPAQQQLPAYPPGQQQLPGSGSSGGSVDELAMALDMAEWTDEDYQRLSDFSSMLADLKVK